MGMSGIGTLFLVSTPIGNLGDMTPRGIELLKSADLIAAEDTRNSIKLLNHFGIHTPMTAYHEFNRFDKADFLVSEMLSGKNVACITDAGTPGISDPGEVLVRKAVDAGIPVSAAPGASAAVTALVISGLPTRRFRFEGFLPKEKKERKQVVSEVADGTATLVFYEAPHRLKETLAVLLAALGDRQAAVCRELTKVHEQVMRCSLSEAVRFFEQEEPRGEYVLVIRGRDPEELREEEQASWEALSVPEHVAFYEAQGLDRKEAMKRAAKDRGVSKREIYAELIGQ